MVEKSLDLATLKRCTSAMRREAAELRKLKPKVSAVEADGLEARATELENMARTLHIREQESKRQVALGIMKDLGEIAGVNIVDDRAMHNAAYRKIMPRLRWLLNE